MAASSEEQFPKTIESYDILGRLGQGAFSSVYKAYCTPKDKHVAIKILVLQDNTEEQYKQIVEEAKIMATLQHDNTMRLLGCFLHEQEIWIITPLSCCSCSDILEHSKFQNGLEEPIIARIIGDVTCGLEYIHKQSIVHSDIKPSNILLDYEGNAKLADFGVSSNLVNALRKRKRTGFAGTIAFAAPEVCHAFLESSSSGSGYDQKADIWSLGITCIQLFEGRNPFAHYATEEEVVDVIVGEQFKIESSFTKDIRKVFKHFVAQCCTYDPTERPPAKELKDHSFLLPLTVTLMEKKDLVQELELQEDNTFYANRIKNILPLSKRPEDKSKEDNESASVEWNFNETIQSAGTENNLRSVVKDVTATIASPVLELEKGGFNEEEKKFSVGCFVTCFGEEKILGQVNWFDENELMYRIKLQNNTISNVASSQVERSYLEKTFETLTSLDKSPGLREYLFFMGTDGDVGEKVTNAVEQIKEAPNTMKPYTNLIKNYKKWKKMKNATEIKPSNAEN